MKSSNTDILSGPITKTIAFMTLPVMLANVMSSFYGLADMSILKLYYDDSIIGAIGVCSTILTLASNLFVGIPTGASVVVARNLGANKKESSERAAMTSIIASLAISFLFLIIGVTFAEKFLIMTNCPESLLPRSALYFRIYFLYFPISALNSAFNAIVRATGDTKRPMYITLVNGAIKVIFTFVFASVFDAGVVGAGLSSAIATTVSCILHLLVILKKDFAVKVNFKRIVFDVQELKRILHIGIPTSIQTSLYAFANVVIVSAVNTFGPNASTGVSIANQFDGIMYNLIHAPSIAVIPFVAQNAGAKNYDRVKKSFLSSILVTTILGAGLGSLSAIFSKQLASIMSSTPEVIAFASQKMVIISSTYFICGINEVLGGLLKGIGRPISPAVTSLIFTCLLRLIWVYAIFPLFPNLTFLYAVWPLGWILSIITLLFIYFPAIKRLQNQKSY